MQKKEVDNLIFEKQLGSVSFGVVFLTSTKGDNKKSWQQNDQKGKKLKEQN